MLPWLNILSFIGAIYSYVAILGTSPPPVPTSPPTGSQNTTVSLLCAHVKLVADTPVPRSLSTTPGGSNSNTLFSALQLSSLKYPFVTHDGQARQTYNEQLAGHELMCLSIHEALAARLGKLENERRFSDDGAAFDAWREALNAAAASLLDMDQRKKYMEWFNEKTRLPRNVWEAECNSIG